MGVLADYIAGLRKTAQAGYKGPLTGPSVGANYGSAPGPGGAGVNVPPPGPSIGHTPGVDYGGATGGGATGGGGINIPTDVYPHSSSGLPGWATPYAQNLATWLQGLFPQYGTTLSNLANLPDVASSYLSSGQQAVASAINRQTQDSLRNMLQNLASTGSTSSYTAQRAMEDIGREALERTQEANQALAANYMKMLFSGLMGAPSAYQGAVGLMPGLLGAGRTAESTDPLAPYRLLVSLLGLY